MKQQPEMKRKRLGTKSPFPRPLGIAEIALALTFAALVYFVSHSISAVFCLLLAFFSYPLVRLCISRRYYVSSAGIQVTTFGRVIHEMPWDKITAAGTWSNENGHKMTFFCSVRPKQIIQYSEKHIRFVKHLTPVSLFEYVPSPPDLKWVEAVSVYLALEGKKKTNAIILLPAKEQHAQLIGQYYREAYPSQAPTAKR